MFSNILIPNSLQEPSREKVCSFNSLLRLRRHSEVTGVMMGSLPSWVVLEAANQNNIIVDAVRCRGLPSISVVGKISTGEHRIECPKKSYPCHF